MQLVHPAEFVPPLQMSTTQMVNLDTLVHHVDLAAERINVVAYSEVTIGFNFSFVKLVLFSLICNYIFSQGPLDLILGPHDPCDAEHVMSAEAENLLATTDMEQVMAAEAQNLFAIEKTEVFNNVYPVCISIESITQNNVTLYISQSQQQTSKGPDVPILRRSSRLVERSGGRYENVVREAMERKARCRNDVELLSALLGRSCSRSENPRYSFY